MPTSSGKKASIWPIFLTAFIDLLGSTFVIPVLAPLFFDPNTKIFSAGFATVHKTQILGLLLAAYPLAQFFGAPILGALSDRVGRRKVLVVSLLGTSIGYLLNGWGVFANSLLLLFIGRIIDGFTGGNMSTIHSAIADVSEGEEKTKRFGMIGVFLGLGFIMGPFIGGLSSDPNLVSWFNYSTPFWFQAILSFLNLLFVIFFFPETLKEPIKSKVKFLSGINGAIRAVNLPSLRVLLVVHFMLMFAFNMFVQFFSVYLVAKFNLNQSQIGNLFAYIGIWVAISQGLLLRAIIKKHKPLSVLTITIVVMGISLLALLLPHRRLDLYFVLPLVAILWGLTLPNIITFISNVAQRNVQGEIMGVTQSNTALANVIPPIIDGFLFALSPGMPIIIAASIIFASWGLFVLYFSKASGKATAAPI